MSTTAPPIGGISDKGKERRKKERGGQEGRDEKRHNRRIEEKTRVE